MLDGLGLVFEKQGGTGAAAFNEPITQVGRNPLDIIASQIAQTNQLKQRQQADTDSQKAKDNLKALNFDFKGWDNDNKAYFTQATKDLLAEGSKLQIAGKHLGDYSDPDVAAWNNKKIDNMRDAEASVNQGKAIEEKIKLAATNPDDYDYEKTSVGLQEYAKLTPAERLGVDINDYVVRKEKPYDVLSPIADVDVDKFAGDDNFENENMSSKKKKLDKTKLRNEINTIANNPLNSEHYQKGLDQGLWKDKKEYEDFLYEKVENRYVQDKDIKIKPKDDEYTIDKINSNGTADEQVAALGVGTQKPNIFNRNGTYSATTVKNAVTLGNINATISGATGYYSEGGKLMDANGKTLTSGTMSTPLVMKDGKVWRVVPVPDKSTKDKPYRLTYTNRDGKRVTEDFIGTQDEVNQQLIDKGIAEYKPMIEGLVKVDDEEKSVWIPADAAVQGTTIKDKVLEGAERAYYVLDRWTKEKNGKSDGGNKKVIDGF
jgi:hypothetical protein